MAKKTKVKAESADYDSPAEKAPASTSSESDEKIIETAKARFKTAMEAWKDVRELALDDLKFAAGDQWDDDIKRSRADDRRPCLTINKIPGFVHHITNDLRQNRPAIKVSPVDSGADIETAKIFQGHIRHIEQSSNADVAYDRAVDSAVRASFGFFRITTEYSDPMSFDQDIKIKSIRDRFSVLLDPSAQEPDGSDANYGFIFDMVQIDEFKAQYPTSELSNTHEWEALVEQSDGWLNESSVRVTEYFYKEWEEKTIVQLQTPSGIFVVEKDKLKDAKLDKSFKILAERKTLVPVIKWKKLYCLDVLESTDWLGLWIPIVPVYGEEIDLGGKRIFESIVRHSKDSQKMYNYFASSEAEVIALAPKAPFIGAAGQFKGFERQWQQANVKNLAYLEYNATGIGNQPLPPPQRNVFEAPVQAISNARMLAADDMKSTTSIYDAAMGAQSNEKSGIAIQRRNIQSQTSNFHFADNLSRSIRHAGRILVDLIPKVYDVERTIRIIGEDDTEEIVEVNKLFQKDGKSKIYNLGVGKYDVTVSSGPSFETKRQEAAASMADLSRSNPALMQLAGDLMVSQMDWPKAKEIAERIKKSLPPGIADDPKDGAQQLPPQVKQQMDQQAQMIDQLTKTVHATQDKLDNKTLELESRERIAIYQTQAQVEIALAKIRAGDAQALLGHEIGVLDNRLNQIDFGEPISNDSQNQNGAGSLGAMAPQVLSPSPAPQNPPTGGQASPGQPMGSQTP